MTGKKPSRLATDIRGELDELIDFYDMAGVTDYAWKPFGPKMRNAEWSYFSFDPPEKQDLAESDRFRDITFPKGMENWFSEDFAPEKAGWSKVRHPSEDLVTSWTAVDPVAMVPTADAARCQRLFGRKRFYCFARPLTFQQSRKAMLTV